ncbi:hypothetical protein RJ640_001477 [Escallonia rubra]|uniref:Pentatricopeptide repeat-containing protein n=1 Tax=Escallonia rubra TaxID=112253 RepID=A0AA88U072_9ASTE|nr:hypothetical protein RJ640_001477 [Escallonia rubra]
MMTSMDRADDKRMMTSLAQAVATAPKLPPTTAAASLFCRWPSPPLPNADRQHRQRDDADEDADRKQIRKPSSSFAKPSPLTLPFIVDVELKSYPFCVSSQWMPIKADSVIWTTLLGACKKHINIKLAELAFQQLIELDLENPSNYVMLSNIYGDAKRWEDVARSKMAMRDTGSRKLPGLSLIEVIGGVVEFYAFDEKHSRKDEIYGALRDLRKLLRSSEYFPDRIEAFDEESM